MCTNLYIFLCNYVCPTHFKRPEKSYRGKLAQHLITIIMLMRFINNSIGSFAVRGYITRTYVPQV